jgi:hypothetical protein
LLTGKVVDSASLLSAIFIAVQIPRLPLLINLSSADSIDFWIKELRCTEAQLYSAMDIVGCAAVDVRKQLEAMAVNKI